MVSESSHFVLVHGACHGAWCWYRLSALLKSAGHTVTTVDLAASVINMTKREDLKSISDYLQPLMHLMNSLPDDDKVVLVAHSMGGLAISVAMKKFSHKIRVALLCPFDASLQGPDYNLDTQFYFDNGTNNPSTAFFFGPIFMATRLYQNSPHEDLELALTLVRIFPSFTDAKSMEETSLSKEKYGSIPRVFIISGEDRGLMVALQKFMIDKNPPSQVLEISDSDHMVMFSRPNELLSYLLDIAAKY